MGVQCHGPKSPSNVASQTYTIPIQSMACCWANGSQRPHPLARVQSQPHPLPQSLTRLQCGASGCECARVRYDVRSATAPSVITYEGPVQGMGHGHASGVCIPRSLPCVLAVCCT